MYVFVNTLPRAIQRTLLQFGYKRKDIGISAKEYASIRSPGGAGQRDYTAVINLTNGEVKTYIGSWGGANMFNPDNKVDLSDEKVEITPNIAVIKGSEGYRSYASLYMHETVVAIYTPEKEEVTEDEKSILRAFSHLKSGPYRKEAIAKVPNNQTIIAALVNRGLLKQSRNGATRITTEGKNAL
jgi:hypothetical protein